MGRETVLVTGGTGFLGSHLVRMFVRQGYQVLVVKRSWSATWRLADVLEEVDFYDLDRKPLASVFEDNPKIALIVHAATDYGRESAMSQVVETNVHFPLQLLELAVACGTETFFNADTALPRRASTYALAKKQFVEWGESLAEAGKIRFVNVVLENIFGEGDDDTKFAAMVIKKCLENAPRLALTPGEQKRDFIYVQDVLSAYELLVRLVPQLRQGYQEYSLGSGVATRIRDFVEMVKRVTQADTALDFAALPYREREVMHSQADVRQLTSLGWKAAYSLEEGVRRCVAWYSEEQEQKARVQQAGLGWKHGGWHKPKGERLVAGGASREPQEAGGV